MQKLLFVLGLLSVVFPAWSQPSTLRGQIVNERSREPLPFVNITIQGTRRGMTSDVEGRFALTLKGDEHILLFSYLGFETRAFDIGQRTADPVLILLREKSTELNEVVIHAGENPAFRIIRKVIRNKPDNDPENLPSFRYHSYNKLILTSEGTGDTARNKSERQMQAFAGRNNFFVGESYTERKFVYPNLSKETVLANQVSGVKDPFFSFLATDLQPFSFYKDYIFLFDRTFLNPVSEGSPAKYDFILQDTLLQGIDSVFVIAFEPLPGTTFDGLKGQLYINTDGYALEHVLARPSDDFSLVDYRIQQKYQKVGEHWFPVQLNAELRLRYYQVAGQKPVYISRSYLSDVVIGPEISKKEFGLLAVEFDPLANRRLPEYWNAHRADSLDKKEKNTYHFYDSLGPQLKLLNRMVKTVENLVLGRFKVGKFYIPLEYLGRINQYEGTRIGFGLQTGERISRVFSLEGYAAYGFKDRAMKYGGALRINLLASKEVYLRYSIRQDVAEPGGSDFIKSPITGNESFRHWLAWRMDSVAGHRLDFAFHPGHYSGITLFAKREARSPAYAYAFLSSSDPGGMRRTYMATEVGLQYRFAYKEAYIQVGHGKAVTKMVYPQINLFVSQGIMAAGGQYRFTKTEIRIDQQWLIRGWGTTRLQFDAGKIVGKVPYPFLFNARGAHYDNAVFNSFFVNNYFQTMGLYEFTGDQFAYLFISHNFGRITGNKIKYIRPEISLVQNTGIGSLSNPLDHQGVVFKTMEKGYFESGLMLSNLFRVNYLSLLYLGMGAGSFYRYGNYSLPRTQDNFSFKLILTLSF